MVDDILSVGMGSVHGQKDFVGADAIATLDVDGGNHAISGGYDVVLHLESLDDAYGSSLLDVVTNLNGHLDHGSLQRSLYGYGTGCTGGSCCRSGGSDRRGSRYRCGSSHGSCYRCCYGSSCRSSNRCIGGNLLNSDIVHNAVYGYVKSFHGEYFLSNSSFVV
jgi:hypothetical protein